MIRLSLNSIERTVWQDVGQQPPVPLPSADDVQRARHLTFAQMYFLYPGAKEHLEWLLAQSPCDPALGQRADRSQALSAEKAFNDFGGNAGVETQLNKLLALDGGT